MEQILKVLVGSHAHGLARPDSDYDYRGVYVTPTSDLLKLGKGGYKGTHWVEGESEDNTSYELAHFLHLATKSNPTILEVFAAPVEAVNETGEELLSLFPHIWSSRAVLAAFTGYSLNQRKKFLDEKYETSERRWKYATAYIRVLLQGIELLQTGVLPIKVPEVWIHELKEMKTGGFSKGHVIDIAEGLRTTFFDTYERIQEQGKENEPDLGMINEFLLKVRQESW